VTHNRPLAKLKKTFPQEHIFMPPQNAFFRDRHYSEVGPTEPAFDDSEQGLHSLLTADELAQFLKVPRGWVYERTRRRGPDRLPFIKLGKYVRFDLNAVRVFLDRQRQP
jgi:excisionase family DNA binding protein